MIKRKTNVVTILLIIIVIIMALFGIHKIFKPTKSLIESTDNIPYFNGTKVLNATSAYVHHGDTQYYLTLEDGKKIVYTINMDLNFCGVYLHETNSDTDLSDADCKNSVNLIKKFITF